MAGMFKMMFAEGGIQYHCWKAKMMVNSQAAIKILTSLRLGQALGPVLVEGQESDHQPFKKDLKPNWRVMASNKKEMLKI